MLVCRGSVFLGRLISTLNLVVLLIAATLIVAISGCDRNAINGGSHLSDDGFGGDPAANGDGGLNGGHGDNGEGNSGYQRPNGFGGTGLDGQGGQENGGVEVGTVCIDCHGDVNSWAPPLDTQGHTDTSLAAIGAHRTHLKTSRFFRSGKCNDCHTVPAADDTTDAHVDPLPAEMVWAPITQMDNVTATYTPANLDAGTAATCTNYCHGASLSGGTNTSPNWTAVDTGEAACGTCHAVPPAAPHPTIAGNDCSGCHPFAFLSPLDNERHGDGILDLNLACTSCHGTPNGSAAPPYDTHGNELTTAIGVGAHASHLGSSDWRAEILCRDCHVVPGDIDESSHLDGDGVAEATFSGTALADGASVKWNRKTTRCTNYCHGNTITGGSNTRPAWTRVGTGEADCGTCHGLPPTPPHVQSGECADCHPTVDADRNVIQPEKHINGIVEFSSNMGCDTCHGQNGEPTPPRDTQNNFDTVQPGVGAHQSHMNGGNWHAPVVCEDCHQVPSAMGDAGHIDTALPAELIWSTKATHDGAVPNYTPGSGDTTCTAYCHGSTLLPGGTNTSPDWVRVDGTEAMCGSCHGLPPRAPHPQIDTCSNCHPTIASDRHFLAPERHIDGVLDLNEGQACDSCHGSNGNPAPPSLARSADTATTLTGVGAHRSHLGGSDWHGPIACNECHTVPNSITSVGHTDTAAPAELTWGPLATADAAVPTWDGANCTNYCHGDTLLAGGSNTTPEWTMVNGTEAVCGSCHGLPPTSAGHPAWDRCSACHPTVDAARNFLDPNSHINGVVDVSTEQACDTCHGANGQAAPPNDLTGNTATTVVGVGAHQSHLTPSDWHNTVTCNDCHQVPTSITTPGHTDTAGGAELTWGILATSNGAVANWDGVSCTNYCHGETLAATPTTDTTPQWTVVDGSQAACGTCHGLPPGGSHPQSDNCSVCHPTIAPPTTPTDISTSTFYDPATHINGVLEVDVGGAACDSCHGRNGSAAPPIDAVHARDSAQVANTVTTAMGVGAHGSHLGASDWHKAVQCSECHIVPPTVLAAGHIDAVAPADLTWGSLASAGGVVPTITTINGTGNCTNYCHGASLTNGSNTAPEWTVVDGTQADCGTCHGLPPGGAHPQVTATCDTCHAEVVAVDQAAPGGYTFIAPNLHIDGIVQRTANHSTGWTNPTLHGATFNAAGANACSNCHGPALDGGTVGVSCDTCHPGWKTNCNFCHGGTDNLTGAPPEAVNGAVGNTLLAVGAHTMHVADTVVHSARNCATCHANVPTSALSSGHIDGTPGAEVVLGPLNPQGVYNPTTGTCSNLYCHGNGSTTTGSATWNNPTNLACNSCHDSTITPWAQVTMSGQHPKHMKKGVQCIACHSTVVNATGDGITHIGQHVNGSPQVSLQQGGVWDPGAVSCNPACHGNKVWY